jgi:hypothetical protein
MSVSSLLGRKIELPLISRTLISRGLDPKWYRISRGTEDRCDILDRERGRQADRALEVGKGEQLKGSSPWRASRPEVGDTGLLPPP